MAALSDVLKRPKLGKIEAGNLSTSDVTQDALGRRLVRLDEVRKNSGDYKNVGGTPQQKGLESFIPRALEAAQRTRTPAHLVTQKSALARLFANRAGKGTPGPVNETVTRLLSLRRGGLI